MIESNALIKLAEFSETADGPIRPYPRLTSRGYVDIFRTCAAKHSPLPAAASAVSDREKVDRMIPSSIWSRFSIDGDMAEQLNTILLFVILFLVSRLCYGWLKRAGLQSEDFSPALASILTTPILAFACGMLGITDLVGNTILSVLIFLMVAMPILTPAIPVLSVLLIVYLCGGFRGRGKARILWVATVSLLIVNYLWIEFVTNHLE